MKGFRSWWYTNGINEKDGYSVFVDNSLVSSGLTWTSAIKFCDGLIDLNVI